MRKSLTALAVLLCASTALAEVTPKAGPKDDRHIQTAVCGQGEVVSLHMMVGRTVAIEMPSAATNNQVYGSDSAYMTGDIPPGSNMIFLKPKKAQAAKPFFILSMMPDGKSQICTLQVDIADAASDPSQAYKQVGAAIQPPIAPPPYKLRIVDTAADAAARTAVWRVAQQKRVEAADQAALRDAVAHPMDTNFRYVLQGSSVSAWNLLPSRHVADDGHDTHFYISSARGVEIYVVAPDGTKAVPDCSPDSETHITTCHQIATQWRIEDGDAHLCVFNRGADVIGTPAPNNTASPDYHRELRTSR